MSLLVSDTDIYGYLDIDAALDDPSGSVLSIRDAVEELLANETNRPFGPSATITDESYDGTGGHLMFTRRPIQAITGIKFRYLTEAVQESYFTLDITQYITWSVGKRRVHSLTYKFPHGYDNVLVSYTTTADQPKLAQQAVREAVATLYRTKGSEDARSEQIGSFQHVMKRKLDESLVWQKAIDNLSNPLIG